MSPSFAPSPSSAANPGGLWQVEAVPAFEDNYLWVLHDGQQALVVDPGDAAVITRFLETRHLTLRGMLLTHHHADHLGGVTALQDRFGAVDVFGPADERIPQRTRTVSDGETLTLAAGAFQVLAVPGHTRSHVAYTWRDRLFCGDTLFALGCGRLFEGTPAELHHSLMRLANLPGEWWVHCAHEYTLANLAFALAVDGDNGALQKRGVQERARRQVGRATVPSLLSAERATNPFLRCDQTAVRAAAEARAGQPLASPVEVLGTLRAWKNTF